MAERFFTESSLQPGDFELRGSEAHHLAAVRRFRPGDEVCLFNGDGRDYPARVLATERRCVKLAVEEALATNRELPFHLRVAAPIPKGDRGQFLVEKLTELGVASYVPLITKRTVIQPRPAKLEKLRRSVIEASKQCGRNILMQVEPTADFASVCRDIQPDNIGVLAHNLEQSAGHDSNFPSQLKGSSPTVAVGPEGGFTEEEIEFALDAGWQIVYLGPRVLRIETAAIVLAALAASSRQPGA